MAVIEVPDGMSHVLTDVVAERERQDRLWGPQRHPWPVWAAILTEEVGEAAEAALHAYWSGDRDLAHLREELIQVAAVAVHIVQRIEAGDRIAPADHSGADRRA